MVTALLLRTPEEVDARFEAMSHDARMSASRLAQVIRLVRRARAARVERGARPVPEGVAMRVDLLSRRGVL